MRVARMTVDWLTIEALKYPKKFPNGAFHWVNDKSISDCLNKKHFEDVSVDCNRQPGEHHHAARIATLVAMMISGVELKRIHVHITRKHLNFEDGNHRLRAYQYLHRTDALRLYVTGRVEVLAMNAVAPPSFFWHRGRLSQVREQTQ